MPFFKLISAKPRSGALLAVDLTDEPVAVIVGAGNADDPRPRVLWQSRVREHPHSESTAGPSIQVDRFLAHLRPQLPSPPAGQIVAIAHRNQYQIFRIERPTVPTTELAASLQWLAAPLVDAPADAIAISWLEIPTNPVFEHRPKEMFLIVAKKSEMQSIADDFSTQSLRLSAISIAETALRDLSTAIEHRHHISGGICLVYANTQGVHITIV